MLKSDAKNQDWSGNPNQDCPTMADDYPRVHSALGAIIGDRRDGTMAGDGL